MRLLNFIVLSFCRKKIVFIRNNYGKLTEMLVEFEI